MFRNPFYAGFVRRQGRLLRGAHEAMVTHEEFERAQEILGRRSFQAKRAHAHVYTGLMRCAYCGQQVTAERKRLRNGSFWDTYHCSDSYRRCTRRGMSLAQVEAAVAESIARVSLDPEAAELGCDEILASLEAERRKVADLVARQEAERAERAARLDKLAEMWLSGLIQDRERYKELEAREIAGANELTVSIERVRGEIEHMAENARRIRDYVSFCAERFAQAPAERKRALAIALGTDLRFYGREKRIEIEIDPLLLEFCAFVRCRTATLEPSKVGFHKEKSAAFGDALLSGRAAKNLI